jgi:uncharacterized protein (TIGR02996 family)
MTDRDAMLRAIAANPDDDTPRLIYADLLDELGGAVNVARARFIRLQIETHREPGEPDGVWPFEPEETFESEEALKQKRAQTQVLAHRYHREWLLEFPTWCNPMFGLLGQTVVDLYSRGFVERVTTKVKPLVLRGAELFDVVPVRELELHGGAAKLISAVFDCPALARLKVLTLRWRNVSDELATAIAECPWLSELIELDLTDCELDERAVRILSRSDRLPALRAIRLGGGCLNAAVVRALAASPKLAGVRELGVWRCRLSESDLDVLREEFPEVTFRA